jgi:hypothetical protein
MKKTIYLFGAVGTFTLLSAGAWLGCSSDTTSSTTADGGTADASGGHDGGASDSGANDTGSADGAPTLSCATYCQTILANCGAVVLNDAGPPNAQYYDTAGCMATCSLWPQGVFNDTANSLGCRQYHATAAAGNAALHCPHAGPGGGGLCGARCEDYCFLVTAHCTVANGADPPYGSNADCLAACNAYPYDTDGGDYDENNIGTLNCLDYHLRESFSDLAGQGIDGGHCDDLSIDGGTVRGACHP